MREARWNGAVRALAAAVLGLALISGLPRPSRAQPPAPHAELARVVGRVEMLRKGQAQWIPAVVGAHLVEGDDIRAFGGASAELKLPDTSTVVLAENSRLLLGKLEFDARNQSRLVLLHLAVGKLRAAVAQAAIALVRARQSNFAISTPTAVAAARGTIVWVFTDGRNSLVAVEPERGVALPSRIDCIPLAGLAGGGPARGQTIFAGSLTTDCGAPVPLPPQFLTFSNPATANAPVLAGGPVAVPPGVLEAVTGTPAGTPVTFGPTTGPGPLAGPPSSTGRDIQANQEQSQTTQQAVQPLSPQ